MPDKGASPSAATINRHREVLDLSGKVHTVPATEKTATLFSEIQINCGNLRAVVLLLGPKNFNISHIVARVLDGFL